MWFSLSMMPMLRRARLIEWIGRQLGTSEGLALHRRRRTQRQGADFTEQLECRIVLTAASIHLSAEQVISTFGDQPYAIVAADLDGDGDLDLASASNGDNRIAWYENQGNLSFVVHTISTSAEKAESIFAADLDDDGDVDLLSASSGDNKVAWYENLGDQNFEAHTISVSAESPISVFAADVDGDGDLDVLSASQDHQIIWYQNRGDQTFTTITIDNRSYGAAGVSAADLDQDGDVDVIAASSTDSTVAWFENDGNEHFTKRIINSQVAGAFAITTADIDDDGDLDVVSASYEDDRVVWYENNGEQVFESHTVTSVASKVFAIFVADIDSDGDLDLFSASASDNRIAWHENDGHQNFTTRTLSDTMQEAGAVIVADLDGDGDLDVIAASAADDKIALFEQQNLIQLSVSSNTGMESESTVITVTATSEFPVSVDQTVALAITGTGITPNDYALSSFAITIPAGQSSGSIALTILNDTVVEALETAILTLANPSSGIDLGNMISQAVTIASDDATRLTIENNGLTEGHAGEQILTFDVTLPDSVDVGFFVEFSLLQGTANNDDLILMTTSPLEFQGVAGEVHTISVTVFGDVAVEQDETFTIQLENITLTTADAVRNVMSGASATGVVFNDDVPVVSIETITGASEGQLQSPGIIRIHQSATTTTGTIVNLAISGTASPESSGDYEPLPLSVVVPAGQTYVDIPMIVLDDQQLEGTEFVVVTIISLGTHDDAVQLDSELDRLTATVSIVDGDQPQITSSPTVSIPENTPVASTILDVDAIAAPALVALSYQLSGTDADQFEIDQSTGQISFRTSPDYELPSDANQDRHYLVTVTVTANVFPQVSISQDIVISVTPVNDNTPELVLESSVTVYENLATSVPVLNVGASDGDLPAASLQISLTGPDAVHFLLSPTGTLTFLASPDFEDPVDADRDNEYSVTLNVSDNGQPALSATQDVSIRVLPVNDNPPRFDSSSHEFVLPENSANGTIVGIVHAADADQPSQAVTYVIADGNPNGTFAINQATGEITVVDSTRLDYESGATFQFRVTATDGGSPALCGDILLTITLSDVVDMPELRLGGAVSWAKQRPPIAILPDIQVGAGAGLAGGKLILTVNEVRSKRAALDVYQFTSVLALGASAGPKSQGGVLRVEVLLNSGVTAEEVQSALRGVKFSTKGKGLKTPARLMAIRLSDSSAHFSEVQQTIQIIKGRR